MCKSCLQVIGIMQLHILGLCHAMCFFALFHKVRGWIATSPSVNMSLLLQKQFIRTPCFRPFMLRDNSCPIFIIELLSLVSKTYLLLPKLFRFFAPQLILTVSNQNKSKNSGWNFTEKSLTCLNVSKLFQLSFIDSTSLF